MSDAMLDLEIEIYSQRRILLQRGERAQRKAAVLPTTNREPEITPEKHSQTPDTVPPPKEANLSGLEKLAARWGSTPSYVVDLADDIRCYIEERFGPLMREVGNLDSYPITVSQALARAKEE